MTLMRRSPSDLDRPAWQGARRLFDGPDTLMDVIGDSALSVEEFRDGDDLVVRAEMPGIDPDDDVEITVSDHTLRLRAERRFETKTEGKRGYRSEFHYGSFSRSVPLPAGATEHDVKATYTDGILEVRIPLDNAEATAKKIPIARA